MRMKEIRSSRRGLTFSFLPQGNQFLIGDTFAYEIDRSTGEIRITPDRDGLETIDYVRTAYQEILKLEAMRNGGVWQVI